MERPTLLIEGWRFHQHPYAIINQFQCLELSQRTDIRLVHRDLPYARRTWRQISGLFSDAQETTLRSIPSAAPIERPDSIFRIGFPFPFQYDRKGARRTCIYGVSEYRKVDDEDFVGALTLQHLMRDTDFSIITPSEWSRDGFIQSGALPNRVVVVPRGYCPSIFHPVDDETRKQYRRELGWDGFVFLSIGSLTERKGTKQLLKAFSVIASRYPEAQLVLKSDSALYPSREMLKRWASTLSTSEMQTIQSRLTLIDSTYSFRDMAKLYQAADAYLAPYHASGTAATVLEAAGCGLLSICSRGGPSDVFTKPEFNLGVESERVSVEYIPGRFGEMLQPNLDHLIDQMDVAMTNSELHINSKNMGPEFVKHRFSWSTVTDQLLQVLFDH